MNGFKKAWAFIKKVFLGAYNLLEDKGYIAVLVTNNLKRMIEHPVVDVITAIIPGEVDNLIVSKLRVILPKVAFKVATVHGIITTHERPSEAIKILFDYLKQIPKDSRAAFWTDFAAELNVNLEDGQMDIQEALERTQDIYWQYFKTK